jgi:hypothetical protein
LPELRKVSGVLVLPDLPLIGSLSELTQSERLEIVQACKDIGVNPLTILQRLGADGTKAKMLDILDICSKGARKPRYDPELDEIIFDGPIRGRTRPLPGLMWGGAFPTITTGPTETFTGSNGTTPFNSNWTNNIDGFTTANPTIQSNAAAGGDTSGFSTAWWNVGTFGPDSEARYQITTHVGTIVSYPGCFLRAKDVGGSNQMDAYNPCIEIRTPGVNDGNIIYEVANAVYTELGSSTATIDVASGDWIGGEVIGTTIRLLHSTDGTNWTQLRSETDGTLTLAGYIGFEFDGSGRRYDNAYFGTVVTASYPTIKAGAVKTEISGTTIVPVLPTHVTNDILVVQALVDAGSNLTISGGWTAIGSAENNANISTAWWWKRAASGAESNPTITSSATLAPGAGGYARTYCLNGCVTSGTPFEDVTFSGPTTSATPASSTVTTTGDRLVVSFASVAESLAWVKPPPPSTWNEVI